MKNHTNESLLKKLHSLNIKFSSDDKIKNQMREICDELIERKVYPKYSSNSKYSALEMVKFYGVDWYLYKNPIKCPHCNSDLRDLKNGPPFKREIGIYDLEQDRTIYHQCPDCNKKI